ncbi:MAG TPA: M13 family metallopeptidase [Steroidobacteraceae bacterium]
MGALAAVCVLGATGGLLAATTGLEGMDLSVAPGDDFFRYANGGWLKEVQIPADRANYGTFAMVTERTQEQTNELLQQAARAAAGSEARKVGDYYAAYMDEAGIEARGFAPLQPALERIASIADRHELARVLGGTLRADVDALNNTNFHTANLFGLWAAADLDNPTRYAPILLQGGLVMPDRDFYLNSAARMATIRDKYRAHIIAMLHLANVADAEGKAQRIFDLEHHIAMVHWDRADSKLVKKGDNHWQRADFDRLAPGLDWKAFLTAAGLDGQPDFIVWQPSAFTGTAALVGSEPLQAWKDWLTFHTIEHAAAYLPKAFVEESFAFNGATLTGATELRPRWKRAASDTSAAMGEAVGKLYVTRYFPAAEKARAEKMIRNLLTSFNARIDRLQWMAPQTKQRAKAKLASMKVSVGYPDHWRDYSGLRVERGDALGNAERAELFEYQRNLAKFGKPVDRGEWAMVPHIVNAVNLPVMNAINIPAGILQPPFFDPKRPQVMDYGAIGAVIGHEISHSFDDEGAQFDAQGRLSNWWTPEDLAHFEAASAQLAAQYDAYHPFPDAAVNGKLTLSENVADVAGAAVAYDAWHLTFTSPASQDAMGFTGEQLFFLSYGQNWRNKVREPAARQQLVTDGHAPTEYRADTVRNLDPWYPAFKVKAGQKLYLEPKDRVRLW